MNILHSIPRDFHASLGEHQILLNFNDDEGAIAFSDWWSYGGGSELFAAWVQKMQVAEGRYQYLTIEDSTIVSWEDGENE